MALPKVTAPTYELELPSSGKKIKYRPFLVKEEKVLLIAMDSEDEKQITNSVIDVLKSCILTRGVRPENLPSFDLEYIFLRIRAASVGEVITLNVTCLDDNTTQVSHDINLNEVEPLPVKQRVKTLRFALYVKRLVLIELRQKFVDVHRCQ